MRDFQPDWKETMLNNFDEADITVIYLLKSSSMGFNSMAWLTHWELLFIRGECVNFPLNGGEFHGGGGLSEKTPVLEK
jgi:hypothetical protein